MATWRLSCRTGGAVEVVADEARREGAHVVLVRWDVVVMWPRPVVVLRVLASDVAAVERVELLGGRSWWRAVDP